MADENWQKVREIFDSALCLPLEKRQKFVQEACGENKTLLIEVESLLLWLETAENFMETPAVAKVADIIETETKKLETGKHFGHYKIIEQLGVGGMGEVYLAQDQKLDRRVAIKILNEKFAAHESNLQRFIQEAKAASALNHPNILVIHEIDEIENAHFMVSEFIKGNTLREILKEKSLKLSEVLEISIQIANALCAAHEARLIHRDIKPENIMLRPDGYVKILDFGLAKLVEQKNKSILGWEESTVQQNQTAKGLILGTINYMSPEQAKGSRVDERTDIFSFGCVLYEMLTGRPPFQGESKAETFANLINREAPPLSGSTAQLPPELPPMVQKMLRKKKDERYQTMQDVLTDLRDLREDLSLNEKLKHTVLPGDQATAVWPATTGDATKSTAKTQNGFSRQIKQHQPWAALALTGLLVGLLVGLLAVGYYFFFRTNTSFGGKKSIAVLPLKPINISNRDELFESGIAETLIHHLSTTKSFIVRPLSATRQYTDLGQDPVAAGREQKTDYVLSSNYQLAEGKIRITAQLFDVRSGQIEVTYKSGEKEAGSIFAMQDAIAQEVGNLLFTRFAAVPNKTVAKRGTTNEEAYLLYLQGKNLTAKRNGADAKKAIEYFEKAIRLDPDYALAFAGMARAYLASGTLTLASAHPREVFEKAREALNKAAELDPNLGDVYAVRGELKFYYEWDFAGAENDFKKAVELEPHNDLAHARYAVWLNHHGRFDESLAEIEIALAIDPNSLEHQRERGRFLYFARRYDEAIMHLERALEIDKNFTTVFGWLLLAYEKKGDYAGAFKWHLEDQKRVNPERLSDFQKTYETGGWEVFRRKIIEFEKLDKRNNFYRLARNHALLNEKQEAFEYLNKAFEQRLPNMTMLKVEPAFDSLRDDPRFDEMVRRVGLK